jgi:hypothetical protein
MKEGRRGFLKRMDMEEKSNEKGGLRCGYPHVPTAR